MKKLQIKRILGIVPGAISWSVILLLSILLIFNTLSAAIVLISYLVFWVFRLLYLSTLLVMAHYRMISKRNVNWLEMCKDLTSDKGPGDILHVVLYTIYKEPSQVLVDSLNALKNIDYPKDKVIVVLAGEEREEGSLLKLAGLKDDYKDCFKDILTTIHPKNVPGEIPCKGANATYAARKIKKYLESEKYDLTNVVISTFDADTCPDKNYFSCLTYQFLRNPKRYQTSFQPLPIYSNNIYKVSALARVIEMGSTFWQLIESMRYEKFVTFSSHSMSFKTLVDVDYWPVDLVSDDSLIFWKCFVKFRGDYTTYSLEVPVYMDIAVGKGFIETIAVQYRQKRRWASGVETFVFLGSHISGDDGIRLSLKIRKLFQILDNHVNWATWAIIISFMTPLLLLWGRVVSQDSLVLFNLSYINSVIFNTLSVIMILCIFISKEFLPPKPKEVSRLIYVSFVLQWLFVPFVSAFLGSIPSLDAQTRLMFNKHLGFYPTPKQRAQ